MKHIFIINPVAGKKNSGEEIEKVLKERTDIDLLIHYTTGPNDAAAFTRKMCKDNPDVRMRFYACGGDGTINSVVNGIYGYKNASFTVYPCGTGNDFVKAFKDVNFKDINALINAKEEEIDVIKVNGRVCVNIANVGFDAAVAYNMVKFKKWPLVSGDGAYVISLFYCLLTQMKHKGKIYVDDKLEFDGKFLMTSVCNGICCGGGFYFAPHAKINDGILNNIICKRISRLKFVSIVNDFKSGRFVDMPKFNKFMSMHNATKFRIESEQDIIYGLDGESYTDNVIDMEIVPKAVRIANPNLQ